MRHRAVDSCREAHCRGVRREQDDSAVARCSRPRLVSGAIGQQNSCVEPDKRREASAAGSANAAFKPFAELRIRFVFTANVYNRGVIVRHPDDGPAYIWRPCRASKIGRRTQTHNIHRAGVKLIKDSQRSTEEPGAQLQLTLQSCALVTGAVRARAAPSESGTAPVLLHPLGAPP